MDRWSLIARMTLAVGLMLAACARVSGAPPSLNRLVTQNSFSSQELELIDQAALHWCEQLATGEPQKVTTARRELLKYVRLPSTAFRLAYSNAVAPRLEPAVKSDQPLASTNALIILGALGTDKALDLALQFCDPRDEPHIHVRLHAVIACGTLMNAESVSPTKVKNAARYIRAAAEREGNGWVLRRQLEALIGVRSLAGEDGDRDAVARTRFAEALTAVISRLDQTDGPSTQILRAVEAVLPKLRDAYLGLRDPEERRSLGQSLAQSLTATFALADKHWETAQTNPECKALYQRTIQICEQMLSRLIDPAVRPAQVPPETDLAKSWSEGNKERFQADLQQWTNVVQQPSYRGH